MEVAEVVQWAKDICSIATCAALVIKPVLGGIKKQLSGDDYGGAVLLGVNGVVVIGHGATSPEAVKNGTLAAARAVRSDLVGRVAAELAGSK